MNGSVITISKEKLEEDVTSIKQETISTKQDKKSAKQEMADEWRL